MRIIMGISTLGFVLVGAASFIFLRTVYRLYFHPLSKIPGPKLAAATHLYEFYYYVVRPGMFLFQMEKMHQQYGPIVRINPREVHVIDPEFYDEIYASSSRKRDQDAKFVSVFGVPDSMVATVGHEHHRFRRGILNEFFSKRSVLGLSELIEERIQKLMRRFEEIQRQQTVVRLDDAFAALTADIITSYCFGRHWGFLEDENFRNDIRRAADDSLKFAHINRFFPWFVRLSRVVSPRAMAILMPGKSALFEFLTSLLDHTMATTHQNQVSGPDEGLQSKNRTMIAALTHPSIPPEERDYYRLRDETFIVVSAGTETTARALSVASYYIASDNALRDTLRTELKQVMVAPASRVTWPELEKLPYLTGVVNETLRLSYGLTGRVPRVAPTETLRYKDYVIPPGTPIGCSSYFIHRDTSIFPDPDKFAPERWVKAAEQGEYLGRYITSFSKGSRVCIGINLAYMELFLTIAYFVRRFDMQLYDTEPEDVRIVRDMMMGYTRRGSLTVYAKLSMTKG